MHYMDRLTGNVRTNAPTRAMMDPNSGSGSLLIAAISDRSRMIREERDIAAERAERETMRLMMNRTGVCG